MRVLLDAHVSGRHVGAPLARAGHHVLGLDRHEELWLLPDEEVLALATAERRIVVTHNVRHFAPLARHWAEARRSHAGLILVTLEHTAYGTILDALGQSFARWPAAADWVDRTVFLARAE